ncbi:LysM peptidoglycan-binding domain-containing protein [Effusibacillus dendaii]|uniref:LysM domain-containing protein n=1 Tax=Effusibacillus dendaii TaxID=2743772 RepID=A0A7I8D4P1_9BACL|nr:LysM peptidoglycan-binding domain-containing protein [Effusibacillus dendaii]BCJ85054.1 hypothetical protein skT53_00390 [Effusibacillus dendaii]
MALGNQHPFIQVQVDQQLSIASGVRGRVADDATVATEITYFDRLGDTYVLEGVIDFSGAVETESDTADSFEKRVAPLTCRLPFALRVPISAQPNFLEVNTRIGQWTVIPIDAETVQLRTDLSIMGLNGKKGYSFYCGEQEVVVTAEEAAASGVGMQQESAEQPEMPAAEPVRSEPEDSTFDEKEWMIESNPSADEQDTIVYKPDSQWLEQLNEALTHSTASDFNGHDTFSESALQIDGMQNADTDTVSEARTSEPETTTVEEATSDQANISAPEAIAEPEAAVEPEAVTVRGETVEPEAVVGQETAIESNVVAEPEAVVEPDAVAVRAETVESEALAEPEAVAELETVAEFEASVEREAVAESEASVEPEAVAEPETSVGQETAEAEQPRGEQTEQSQEEETFQFEAIAGETAPDTAVPVASAADLAHKVIAELKKEADVEIKAEVPELKIGGYEVKKETVTVEQETVGEPDEDSNDAIVAATDSASVPVAEADGADKEAAGKLKFSLGVKQEDLTPVKLSGLLYGSVTKDAVPESVEPEIRNEETQIEDVSVPNYLQSEPIVTESGGTESDQVAQAETGNEESVQEESGETARPSIWGRWLEKQMESKYTIKFRIVQESDSLDQLAAKYETPIENLMRANGLTNEQIDPGQVIRIPLKRR